MLYSNPNRNYRLSQKLRLLAILLALILPLSLALVLKPAKLSLAMPITSPITPITPPNPSPLPTLAPTASPTPKPIENHPPVIITNNLPNGTIYSSYSAKIEGLDYDQNDRLSMIIPNLPAGIKKSFCQTTKYNNKKVVLTCYLNGRPQRAGQYWVRVFLFDDKGAFSQKLISLVIKPAKNTR